MSDPPLPPLPPGPPTLDDVPAVEPPPPPPGTNRRVRATRRRLAFYDRFKILVFLAVLFTFFVMKQHADIPIMSWGDAFDDQLRAKWWVFALGGLEILRQIHFLISEHWARYHRIWTDKVWGRWDRFVQRRDPWLRYRLGRVAKVAFFVTIAAFLLGAKWDISPVQALVEAPSRLFDTLFSNPAQGMPLGLYVMFIVGVTLFQFIALFWFLSKGGVDTYMPDEVETRFDDVWGQDHVLERVRENIVFLENPEELEARGGHVPGGILLWGPPGTGKTLMAEAVAGETGRPYVFVDPGAFTNMFMGVGILKVKSLFRRLRKLALRFGGVIVFFDEADALGNRGGGVSQGHSRSDAVFGADTCHGGAFLSAPGRWEVFSAALPAALPEGPSVGGIRKIIMGGMGGRGGMGELQILLSELSGLKKPRGFFNRRVRQFLTMTPKPPPKYRILVMMASNMPDSLDPALLRPGRLDRIYKVGYPAKEGRRKTYEGYFAKVRHELTPQQIEKLATITPYATGATIKDLVNESMLVAMRNGRDTITWPDVIEAKKLKQVGPGENVDYIERERHSVAVHEACHAVMAYRVQKGHDIDIATIEKGADFLGFVQPIPLEERFTSWRSTFENDVLVSLASLAGERLFFDGDNSSGVSGDLRSATSVSIAMEAYWGMGATVSSHAVTSGLGGGGGSNVLVREANLLRGDLGARVEARLGELLDRAVSILEDNRFEVLAVAHALETHKTITGDDIAAIITGSQGPLVDGRVYHDEAFLRMAEEYHRSALDAHREQGRIDLPLPVFEPPRALAGVLGSDAPSRWQ
jgi:cell division protease FtsH